jgi:hypothetical protein
MPGEHLQKIQDVSAARLQISGKTGRTAAAAISYPPGAGSEQGLSTIGFYNIAQRQMTSCHGAKTICGDLDPALRAVDQPAQ